MRLDVAWRASEAASDGRYVMPMFFRPNVEKLEQKGDVDALVKALAHKDASVRDDAAGALGRMGDPRAVEPLIRELERRIWDVNRCWTNLTALRVLGQPDPTPEREKAIEDAEEGARKVISALTPFARTGDLRAVAAVRLHNDDRKPWGVAVSSALAEALTTDLLMRALGSGDLADFTMPLARGRYDTKTESIAATTDLRVWAADELGKAGDPRAVEPLIAALRDRDAAVTSQAAVALAQLGDAAVEPLITALRDEASRPQWASVARLLGQAGDRRAVEPLGLTLADADGEARLAAAEALGKLGDPRAVDPLVHALGDADETVGSAAADALGAIGDERAVDDLAATIADSRPGRAAMDALGKIGGERAVEALATAAGSSDRTVRELALSALGKVGGERAIEALEGMLADSSVRPRAVDALRRTGSARAVAPLLAALDDDNAQDVVWALEDVLEQSKESADADVLRRVIALGDHVRYWPASWKEALDRGCDFGPEQVSCSAVRQLARQELIRRGLKA